MNPPGRKVGRVRLISRPSTGTRGTLAPATTPTRLRRLLANSPIAWALLPLGVVVLLGCVYNQDGAFFAWETHRAMLREISVLGILACGMTVVVITGGIDLSVGSVLALSAVSYSLLTLHHGWGSLSALLSVLAIGAIAGVISGLLVARARIQPFVVTLATMVFARGLAKYLSGGKEGGTHARRTRRRLAVRAARHPDARGQPRDRDPGALRLCPGGRR